MQKIFLFAALCFASLPSFSQSTYFQQSVQYDIDVTLDDQQHILRAFEKIKYNNQSKDTLHEIYFHLWPNAYKNDRSAYTEQEVENGKTDFYYSKDSSKGFIDSIDFRVNNEMVETGYVNDHEDILFVRLNAPLLPGQSIEISTPFRVKIPTCFSRLGHTGQSYQITQWYPKPAVYDTKGWHPMPYLNQGEFYSEYGSFTVRIHLPANYVVAATGDLQEKEEQAFLETRIHDSIAKQNNTRTGNKTITYKQDHVHDFAWIADKDFEIEKQSITLSSGRKVDCVSYFKPSNAVLYKGSSKIIAQTVQYLSDHVGEYPYSHASVADASLIAGDGMEYPNVAILGKTGSRSMLQTVIIHEVGHNWFYGLLGSNERDHAWMDEGMNTFYEQAIDKQIKEGDSLFSNKRESFSESLNGAFIYQLMAKVHEDQPIDIHAGLFTSINYGAIPYQKTGAMIKYLQAYLGKDTFEIVMKKYFQDWHFKHPYPEDFRNVITKISHKSCDWFFEDGLQTKKTIDFAIGRMHTAADGNSIVKIKNRTSFRGPVEVSACKGDSVLSAQWIEYPYTTPAQFSADVKQKANAFRIDPNENIPEIKRSNNTLQIHALIQRWKPALRLGTSLGISTKQKLYVLPGMGYNAYDGFQLGMIWHNLELPNRKFQFALMPLYALDSKEITGSGFVSYTSYPSFAKHVIFGIETRSYHNAESHVNITRPMYTRYIKMAPFIEMEWKHTARAPQRNQLKLRYIHLRQNAFYYTLNSTDSLFRPALSGYSIRSFGQARFIHTNKRTFNPFAYQLNVVGNHRMLKVSAEGQAKIDYLMKGKAFYVRAYAGSYIDWASSTPVFADRNQYLQTNSRANNDILFDEIYLGRNEQVGWMSKQISTNEGGLKVGTPLLSTPVGQSNQWLSALNLRSDLPIRMPLKIQVFFDAATFANARLLNSSGNRYLYDAGLECHLFGDMLIIYAPLLMSPDLRDYTKSVYTKNRFAESMSFSLNLHKLSWYKTQNVLDLMKF